MHPATRLAFWPLPFALVALVCAALEWPGTESGTRIVIATLNYALLYGAALAVARFGFKELTGRRIVIASLFALVYHAVAFALPRPESGLIRIGPGDLMLAGGALVYAGVEEVVTPLRRGALRDPQRLRRALTTDDETRFRVLAAAADADGWLLYGRLQGPQGHSVWHVARVREPFALTTTPLDTIAASGVFHEGALHALGEDALLRAAPGAPAEVVQLPEQTAQWLVSQPSRQSAVHDGDWLVLIAGSDGGAVGRIAPDGRLAETVQLPVTQANAQSITQVGAVTYALTEHYDAPRQWVGHVLERGARDPARSDALTEVLAAHDLASPVRVVGAGTQLWLIGYHLPSAAAVAIAYPDGVPIPIRPGSITAVAPDGGQLLVGTTHAVLRVGPAGVAPVAEGSVPEGMLSVHDGTPSGALRGPQQALSLYTFDAERGPRAFLPELRLWTE